MAGLSYRVPRSIVVAASLVFCLQAYAEPNSRVVVPTTDDILDNENLSQITAVSELSDVEPTGWAFTAVQSLAERYGCIVGYPDQTYRGNRSLGRYEFAAGLQACLDKINEILATGLAEKVTKDDLATLQRLQEEFAAELATLKGRVDALQSQVATLEQQQFSPVTKLSTTVQFVPAFLTNAVGNPPPGGGSGGPPPTGPGGVLPPPPTLGTGLRRGENSNLVLGGRVRLNFNTSFSGADLLRVRLQFGNVTLFNPPNVGTNMTRLGFDENTNGNFQIDDLYYRFPIGENITVFVGTNSLDFDEVFDNVSVVDSSERGALSRFNRRDALTFRGPEGSGVAVIFQATDQLDIGLTYLADQDDAPNPSGQAGLTNGGYSTGVQLLFKPIKTLKLSAVYRHAFEPAPGVNLGGSTGSVFTSRPLGRVDTSSDRYAFLFDWQASNSFSIGGSVSYANARSEAAPNRGASADLLTWTVNLGFPNLFGEGHYGAILFGQPPRVTSVSTGTNPDDRGTAYNLEFFYRYRVSRNITVQPGFFLVFNPEHNSANGTVFVGALRTSFSF